MMKTNHQAVALISGGLDSMLAAKIVQEQGILVEGINFFTGFCVEGHTHAIRKKDKAKGKRNHALWVAEQLGIKLHIVDIIEPYKTIVINPKHGYGAHLNPCLDCKVFMVSKAKDWISEHGFDFIITGEVIGQRPMSQRKDAMPVVSRESGADELLLRPLCAKLLPPSLPEKEGWIDRESLYDFNGRTRKPQMAMTKKFAIDDYAQPAGGCCFLTDEHYSDKLTDLWAARGSKDYELDDIMLLKVGRHLRPRPNFKMIIAREEGEAKFLGGYKKSYTHMNPVSHNGPLALIDGEPTEEDLELAAALTARYSQGRGAERVDVRIVHQGKERNVTVTPMPAHQVPTEWHI